MSSQQLVLTFEEITEADVPELTRVMTRAFDDDTRRHLGQERGGPDGYDNGEFFRRWLFGYEQTRGHRIVTDGRTIGACIVWVFDHGRNHLGTIFVDPDYQNRGVATRAWQFIEARYPEARSWTLETPAWATRNHRFYDRRCGFHRVEMRGDVIVYRKELQQKGPDA